MGLLVELTKEQKELVTKIKEREVACICSPPGSGKTVMAISDYEDKNIEGSCAFVICPKSAIISWEKNLSRNTDYSFYIFDTVETINNFNFQYYNFYVISFPVFTSYFNFFEKLIKCNFPYKVLYLDEVHQCKGDLSNISICIRYIFKYMNKKVFLSASPITRREFVRDIYRIMRIVDSNIFGNLRAYLDKYAVYDYNLYYTKDRIPDEAREINPVYEPLFMDNKNKLKNYKDLKVVYYNGQYYIKGTNKYTRKKIIFRGYREIVDVKNYEELIEKVKEYFYFYVRDVDIELDFKYIEFNDEEQKRYEIYLKDVLKGSILDKTRIRYDLLKFVDNGFEGKEDTEELTTKEKSFIEYINKNKFDSPLIIYTYLLNVQSRLKRLIEKYSDYKVYEINGSVSLKKRKEISNNLKVGECVIITESGTESIDFSQCNRVIFYSIPNLKNFIQTVGRITRLNSIFDKYHVTFFIYKDSIDYYNYSVLQTVFTKVSSIFGGKSMFENDFDMEERENGITQYIKDLKDKYLWKKSRV